MKDLLHIIAGNYLMCIKFVFYSLDYKFNDECERVFHVNCIDINKHEYLNSCKTNDLLCIEIQSSVDKFICLNTTWLCAKYKYTRYDMIESTNLEDKL